MERLDYEIKRVIDLRGEILKKLNYKKSAAPLTGGSADFLFMMMINMSSSQSLNWKYMMTRLIHMRNSSRF